MFEARIHHLFHAKQFGLLFGEAGVDDLLQIREADVDVVRRSVMRPLRSVRRLLLIRIPIITARVGTPIAKTVCISVTL